MKVSILTACYNKQKFIAACVKSIIEQTYDDWEMIIVDDCSSDGSDEILARIDDPRIKVFRNKTRQLCSSTYARALSYASGDICGVVDGDDLLSSKAMDMIVKRYKWHPDIDHIYTQFHWCNKSLKKCRGGLSTLPKKGKSLVEMALGGVHCYSHWRTFKRHLADKGVLFPAGLEVSVDKSLGFRLEELGKGAFLPKRLYYYRYYHGNMSLVQPKQQKSTTIKMAKTHKARRLDQKTKVYPIIEIK